MRCVVAAILLIASCLSFADIVSDSALHKMRSGNYDRYVYVRGQNLESPRSKLIEYANLGAPESPYIYQFEIGIESNWTVFKFPASTSHWMFLNVTYWFLGWGDEDANYADDIVGLAVARDSSSVSYVVYVSNDHPVPRDSMYGAMRNGLSYTINVPFDEVTVGYRGSVPSVEAALEEIGFEAPEFGKVEVLDVTYYGGLEQRAP